MRQTIAVLAVLLLSYTSAIAAAEPECKTFGFSVNDYGKAGPTRDAQTMLDKYIAKYAGKHGIKNYKIGAKTVTCKLFLDFGFFDEHMCKAEARVCWPTKQNS